MRLKRVGLFAAALAAMGLGSFSSSAKAAAVLSIFAQETGVNGGLVTQVGVSGTFGLAGTSFSGTYGDFSISVFSSTSDNTNGLSDLLSTTNSITNSNFLTGGAHSLQLWVSETDYSLPTGGPLTMESGLAGSEVAGTTVGLSGIFQAWFDAGDNMRGTTGGSNGPQTAIQTGTTFDTGSGSGQYAHTDSSLYSLTSEAAINNLSAGGKVNYADHVNVSGVPVPAAAWMGLSTLAGLAGMGLVRRRRTA